MIEVSTEQFAAICARALDDKLAKNIVILDISKVSSLADYFVIASGESPTQVKALTENLQDRIKTLFQRLPKGVEKDMKNRWNLVDFSDVVVHILHTEERDAYKIEKFWSHAFSLPQEKWKELSKDYSEYSE